jgi:hypothetical protein
MVFLMHVLCPAHSSGFDPHHSVTVRVQIMDILHCPVNTSLLDSASRLNTIVKRLQYRFFCLVWEASLQIHNNDLKKV